MPRKPSSPIVALISLLIFLLTGQAGVQGYVWCLGEDGHVALEVAAGGGCGPEASSAFGGDPCDDGPVLDEEHCGPCLDLPASFDAASSRRSEDSNSSASFALLPEAVIQSPLNEPAGAADPSLFAQPPPRISQNILFQRTIVLLN